ncbi:MAG: hypothetical protein WCH86_02340 [Kiritimatiellales bacterium]
MCGGSDSSTASTQETTNIQADTTSTGGGLTVGSNGQFFAQDNSTEVTLGDGGGTNLLIGDNSSAILQQLDKNTADLLLSAVAVLGNNANNFMALSAGRNPDIKLADTTTEILADGKTNPLLTFIQTNAGRLALAALAGSLIIAAVVFPRGRRRKK